MKRKIGIIHGAFIFSLFAHLCTFIFLKRLHKTLPTSAPRYQTVSLQMRGNMSTSSVKSLQEPKGSRKKSNFPELTDVVLSQPKEAEANPVAPSAISTQNVDATKDSLTSEHTPATQTSESSLGVDSAQHTASVKNSVQEPITQGGFTGPCQHISMPVQWTQLKNVWPRKYTVELLPQENAHGMALTVVRMQPVAAAIPLLDRRVQSAFVDCLLNQKNIPVQMAGALNPSRAEAYSAEIEFFPDNPNVASQ